MRRAASPGHWAAATILGARADRGFRPAGLASEARSGNVSLDVGQPSPSIGLDTQKFARSDSNPWVLIRDGRPREGVRGQRCARVLSGGPSDLLRAASSVDCFVAALRLTEVNADVETAERAQGRDASSSPARPSPWQGLAPANSGLDAHCVRSPERAVLEDPKTSFTHKKPPRKELWGAGERSTNAPEIGAASTETGAMSYSKYVSACPASTPRCAGENPGWLRKNRAKLNRTRHPNLRTPLRSNGSSLRAGYKVFRARRALQSP
jgi:hypothetical protein